MQQDIYIVSALRTAIGSFGGTLKDTPLADLAAAVVREAVARSGAAPDTVGHVSMGTVIATEPRDIYLSRIAALEAGLPQSVSAFNVNRLCDRACRPSCPPRRPSRPATASSPWARARNPCRARATWRPPCAGAPAWAMRPCST